MIVSHGKWPHMSCVLGFQKWWTWSVLDTNKAVICKASHWAGQELTLKLSFSLCERCMCFCVHVLACVWLYVCMWRPNVGIWSLLGLLLHILPLLGPVIFVLHRDSLFYLSGLQVCSGIPSPPPEVGIVGLGVYAGALDLRCGSHLSTKCFSHCTISTAIQPLIFHCLICALHTFYSLFSFYYLNVQSPHSNGRTAAFGTIIPHTQPSKSS